MAENRSAVYTASTVQAQKHIKQQRIRAVYGGNDTMRDGGKSYLPKFAQEQEDVYSKRRMAAHMNNHLAPAIDGYVGRIFAKPVVLPDRDNDKETKDLWEDIDLRGNNGDVFFQSVVRSAILDGIAWVIVDYPKNTAANLREERQNRIRPYCRYYEDTDVLFVETDDNGRITEFRTKERAYVRRDDGYTQEQKEYVRRLYIDGEAGSVCYQLHLEDKIIEEGVMSYPSKYGLPIVPYITSRQQLNILGDVTPPLMDAADQCIRLWQSISEQDNCLTLARCPFLFASGWAPPDEKKGIPITPNCAYWTDQPDANLKWVEHSGAALEAGLADITKLESDIASMLLKPLQNDKERTAYESKSDDTRASSPIKRWATAAKDMMENVLAAIAHWGNKDDGGSIELISNLEYQESNSAELTVLFNLYTANAMPLKNLLGEYKRRGILADDYDIDASIAASEAEGMTHLPVDKE